MFDLRPFSFFANHNDFTGSKDALRYRIHPEEETLLLWTWTEDLCFELADPGEPESFPLTEEGLAAVKARLTERYAALLVR